MPRFVKKNLHAKKFFSKGGYFGLTSELTGEGVILLHLFLLLGMGLYLENCIPIRQTHSHCYCDEHKPH